MTLTDSKTTILFLLTITLALSCQKKAVKQLSNAEPVANDSVQTTNQINDLKDLPPNNKAAKPPASQQPQATYSTNAKHNQRYLRLKGSITKSKQNLRTSSSESLSITKQSFETWLVDSIFTYWYGTTWDFNGYTAVPRKGDVACGYFVSTTVRDMGIDINRYKVAQKAASEIVRELCDSSSTKWFNDVNDLDHFVAQRPDNEVYIIGLDNHVGFIVRRNGLSYFIHSSYIDRAGVMKERLLASLPIQYSQRYYIGSLSGSEKLLRMWLN
ncbi:MAG: hypothetical protein ACI8ZN_002257 [Bacteroidia bacterium]|jgi:hypothetical protein